MTRSRVDDTRWQQVEARDRAADGRFVYAVTSTGIFCRPSCPSRRPRRDRVRFFDAPDAAAQAGFRPCLRCRPLDPQCDTWLPRIEQACRRLATADAPVPLAALAREARTSPHHFLRQFTRVVGVTPREFADARRFATVRRHLRSGADVTTALFEAGYGSGSRFYEQAAPRLAMPPSTYRTGGAGQHVRYTTARSPLGRLLVASTDTGVCAVSLGESDTALVAALRAEYPKATVARASVPPSRTPAAGAGLSRRAHAAPRTAARHPRHRVPVAGVVCAARHSRGHHHDLRRGRRSDRASGGRACRSPGVRHQSRRARHSVSPRRAGVWRGRWLPVGSASQDATAPTGTAKRHALSGVRDLDPNSRRIAFLLNLSARHSRARSGLDRSCGRSGGYTRSTATQPG